MIYCDDREPEDIVKLISKRMKTEVIRLEYGDYMFEGHGPKGACAVAIERKSIRDLIGSALRETRLQEHQLPGMLETYDFSFLLVEGAWSTNNDGFLTEYDRVLTTPKGPVMASEVTRFLKSVQIQGKIPVLHSRGIAATAYEVVDLYHWFQKGWDKHLSLKAVSSGPVSPLLTKPSLVHKWASSLPGIGVDKVSACGRSFKSPYELATADAEDWLGIVGAKGADKIIKAIRSRVK